MVSKNIDKDISKDIFSLIKSLFPICRSITGNGTRNTLESIKEYLPLLKIFKVPSGTKVFDWIVPKEWNIKDAYIKNSKGEKIIDFKKSNLHVLQYSRPINKKVSLKELKNHLYTLPDHPDWIPHVTSFYNENWGFSISYNEYKDLKDDEYEVFIDSTLENGFLDYAELYLKGKSRDEILFTTHICHPSLCNDNLSGLALLVFLAKHVSKLNRKYSYRFLFIPEMIGSITWLALNEDKIKNIKGGFTVTCVGDSGNLTYKKTKNGNSYIDKIVEKILIDSRDSYKIIDFSPYGSDERQFSSLGFNLSIGSLMRTPYCEFDEFHTSADNLSFIKEEYLFDSYNKYVDILFVLENDERYLNLNPNCEPQLVKRGLYRKIGGGKKNFNKQLAMLWILTLADGINSLLDISIRSKIDFQIIRSVAYDLLNAGLLKQIEIDNKLVGKWKENEKIF